MPEIPKVASAKQPEAGVIGDAPSGAQSQRAVRRSFAEYDEAGKSLQMAVKSA
jgi:hypothetical protein